MKGKKYENRTVSFAISSKGEKMKVENISYRVDHRILFANISFDTLSSGVTLITGKNGTGKSTLL
ncbi:TPA: AAA family ATPase [Streptococcus pneumoniae]|uniref:AAA family ATPase n=2 Tax=Streptococcus pneumoniae TaxID=1313 RepID=UPI0009915106|nr:AAA family ATPase [Streptococcus pneumoniae]MDS2415162.1 AAA family ATPase [Streptococcus pneumoniae]MDS2661769.1 AAA family ATPase [Streptococcus pneumoniae]MDS2893818.1 AAA family ATPase [Streptococcus pneumoniae]MDS2915504.1 AAA family ATPase [Streptococcus pneumoniae]MDS2990173.1 AAA family ATPase [Streptococcus pneumoniae]